MEHVRHDAIDGAANVKMSCSCDQGDQMHDLRNEELTLYDVLWRVADHQKQASEARNLVPVHILRKIPRRLD